MHTHKRILILHDILPKTQDFHIRPDCAGGAGLCGIFNAGAYPRYSVRPPYQVGQRTAVALPKLCGWRGGRGRNQNGFAQP